MKKMEQNSTPAIPGSTQSLARGGAAGDATDGLEITSAPLPGPVSAAGTPKSSVEAPSLGGSATDQWDPSLPRFPSQSAVAPGLQIYGPAGFHEEVEKALQRILVAPSGRKLIAGFAGPAGKKNFVTITDNGPKDATYPRLNQYQSDYVKSEGKNLDAVAQNQLAAGLAQKRGFGRKGQGANAEIVWRPRDALQLNQKGRPTGIIDKPDEAYLALAHELVHARRIVKGTYTGAVGDNHDPSTPAGKEELRAVGIGSFRNRTRVSENSVRKDLKLPLRTSYNKVGEDPPAPVGKKSKGLGL